MRRCANTKITSLVGYNIKRGLKICSFNPSNNSHLFYMRKNGSLSRRITAVGSRIQPRFVAAHLCGKDVCYGVRYISGGSGIAKYLVTPLLGKIGAMLWKEGFHGTEHINRSIRNLLKAMFILGITLLPFFFFYHVDEVYTPEIKRKRFLLFKSTAQLKLIESSQYKKWMKIYEEHGLDSRHPLYTRVNNLRDGIINNNYYVENITKMDWQVYIIKGETPQAKVFSNGNIFITTETIKASMSDTQIAIILGQGMAHCILSHPAEKYSMSMLNNVTTFFPLVAIWLGIGNSDVFGDLLAVFWTRKVMSFADESESICNTEMEHEAEEFAIKLLVKAGHDIEYRRAGNKYLHNLFVNVPRAFALIENDNKNKD